MKIPQAVHDFVAGNYSTTIAESNAVGGGCISSTQRISLSNGTELLLKVNPPIRGLFRAEANGLLEIAKSKTIKVPHVLAHDEDFLLTEFIQSSRGAVSSGFFEAFGRELAALHSSISSGFGFYEDNFIGSTPQRIPARLQTGSGLIFLCITGLSFNSNSLNPEGNRRRSYGRSLPKPFQLFIHYYWIITNRLPCSTEICGAATMLREPTARPR